MRYVRLRLGSNWGSLYLARWPTPTRGGTSDTSRALRWESGEPVPIRFNGREEVVPIYAVPLDTSYGDMGQNCPASAIVPRVGVGGTLLGLEQVEIGEEWYAAHKSPTDVPWVRHNGGVTHHSKADPAVTADPPFGESDTGTRWTRKCSACNQGPPDMVWNGSAWEEV